MLLQQLVNGIITGSVYALFALGFNLVLGALGILNIAQGATFTWGAFTGLYMVMRFNLPFPLALISAMVAGGVINVLIETLVFLPLRLRGGSGLLTLVASIGASMVLVSLAQLTSEAQVVRFPFGTLPETQWILLGKVRFSFTQGAVLVTTLIVMAGTYVLLQRTRLGKAIRTISFSERTAKMLGVPTVSVARWTFFISGSLGGLAGVLIGVMFSTVHFMMGEPYILKAFAAIVIGGFGSVVGTIVASMFLGLIEVTSTVIGYGAFRDVITFSLLFFFLLVRPYGLFGKEEDPHS